MNALKRLALPLYRYWRNNSAELQRRRQEDFLKALYHYGHSSPDAERVEHIRRRARISRGQLPHIVGQLVLDGLIESNPLSLTEQGCKEVLRLIRTHRIYEKYLAEHSGYTPEEWHTVAEEMEHKLSPEERERIARLLRNPLWDPHGDPIPTEGNLLPGNSQHEAEAEVGKWYEILHIEDDEDSLYKELIRTGLAQGCIFKCVDISAEYIHLFCEGEELRLSHKALACLNLKHLPTDSPEVKTASEVRRLSQLRQGELAEIVALSPACVGAMRRRLLDLGFVRGSEVSIDMRSPMGNPTAYVVRYTAIALRQDQARYILVKPRSQKHFLVS